MEDTIDIRDIQIGTRFRKEYGDVEGLAKSISETGLLHPVVLDNENRLITGLLRIEAYRRLGRSVIPCVRINGDPRACELAENTFRHKYSVSEVAAISDYVKNRRRAGGPGQKTKGRTREMVGKVMGHSPRQIQKITDILKNAEREPGLRYLLKDVDSGKKSVDTAHRIATRKERALPNPSMPEGRYDVILCDVPIRYESTTRSDGSAHHYSTMTVNELCRLDVPSADRAVIFFWMSPSIMYHTVKRKKVVPGVSGGDGENSETVMVETPTYKAILDAWGFATVKGEFVWDKERMGAGTVTRNRHEHCLIAFKGRMPMPAESFPSVIRAPRAEYSRKPDELYGMIERMYPGRTEYLELFGRQKHSDAWKVYGDEPDHFGGGDGGG